MNRTSRIALVTGGARRVGRAIALELARAGCDVAAHFQNSSDDAEKTAAEIRNIGRRAVTLAADLADPQQASALPQAAAEALGGLDILVNSASIFEPTPIDTLSLADWQRTLSINLTAPMLLAQAAAPLMRSTRSGPGDAQREGAACIVNLTDIAAERPWGNYLAYCAAKGGLATLTRALARALAPDIRVNAVAPGAILFPENYSEEKKDRIVARVPAQRPGNPDDVAAAVRFLADARYVSGHTLAVDGGRLLAW